MHKYRDLVELAQMCAHNARSAATEEVARELWQMAEEYQAKAATLGSTPEIGAPPSKRR
jgi:hypothetical protein